MIDIQDFTGYYQRRSFAAKEKIMSNRDIVNRIEKFNQGRIAEILPLKYQAIRQSPFIFLRGTSHLFYEDWPQDSVLNKAPAVWMTGDLHLENFGCYKGDDRQIYFGINDFDEGGLAPCTWDLARFLTSLVVASDSFKITKEDGQKLCQSFLDTYTNELKKGQARSVENDTAQGLVADLIKSLKDRDREQFLNKRTTVVDKKRQFIINQKLRKIAKKPKEDIKALIENWAQQQPNPKFFKVLDIGFRIAGTGSLGVNRYAILVEGKGSPNRNYLLDMKEQPNPALNPYFQLPQPQWKHNAERVQKLQQWVQVASPALLTTLEFEGKSYLLRELQPTQDKVDLAESEGKFKRADKVIRTMAQVTAWAQLHSSGRKGSATIDDLIAFAEDTSWHKDLLDYATSYALMVEADYKEFCANSPFAS